MFKSISNLFKKEKSDKYTDDNSHKNNSNVSLYDEKGQKHFLSEKLGQGGQGVVYRTTDKNIIIKMKTTGDSGLPFKANEQQYDAYKSEVNEVRILAIPKEVKIAKPIELLTAPFCGYTMLMLECMQPIKKMIIIPQDAKPMQFYVESGGLQKRLEILKETAKNFMFLHSNGFVYGDISPENIFYSGNSNEVWLIDSDNLRSMVDFKKTIETPEYAAPEIHNQTSPNTIFSDTYSFARLAFQVLTLGKPFEGELLLNGSGGWDTDDDKDYYELAEQGDVPWVGDEDDDSNFSDNGIPINLVMNKEIYKLFQRTLGYKGRKEILSRPSMSEWYQAFFQALDTLIDCEKCKSTFYNNHQCPFCDATAPALVEFRSFEYYNDADLEKDYRRKLFSSLSLSCNLNEKYIRMSHLFPILAEDDDLPLLKIETANNQLKITNLSDLALYEQKKGERFPKNTALVIDKNNQIVFRANTNSDIVSVIFGLKY